MTSHRLDVVIGPDEAVLMEHHDVSVANHEKQLQRTEDIQLQAFGCFREWLFMSAPTKEGNKHMQGTHRIPSQPLLSWQQQS